MLVIKEIKAYKTKEIIKIINVIAWSWKEIKSFIMGEAASCNLS